MSYTAISVESVSKSYRLGVIGTGTFRGDWQRWWAKLRGLPDPHLRIGEVDHGNRQGETLWALKDISLQVRQGEALGIIGRNGAGKSTLLKILSRVTAPTSGEVRVRGRIASLLEVGTGFHPELTGRENIFLNGAILGMARLEIKRKFDEIVAFAEIERFLDTPVKRYSSGMYVRLAFAVAAHLEQELLMVDEVLAVGDIAFQRKCLGKMGSVAREGRTVIFVSHNMGAVVNLCNRGVLLREGKISWEGDIRETVSRYLSVPVAAGDVDLSVVVDRSGNGRARFTRVVTRSDSANVVDTFVIGDDIVFDFSIHSSEFIRSGKMGLQIISSEGISVYLLTAEDAGFELTDLEGESRVRVVLENQKIYPGEYYVNLWMGDSAYEALDRIEHAIMFTVVEGGTVVRRQLDRSAAVVHEVAKWLRMS
jgi:lipopolysaccharide transport system ATP-binding protein